MKDGKITLKEFEYACTHLGKLLYEGKIQFNPTSLIYEKLMSSVNVKNGLIGLIATNSMRDYNENVIFNKVKYDEGVLSYDKALESIKNIEDRELKNILLRVFE